MRWDWKTAVSTLVLSTLVCILSFMPQSEAVVALPEASGNFVDKPIPSKINCTDVGYAKELPPHGPACEKELFARRGKPYMFPVRDGIAFGVSSAPDKPSTLYLWVENQTEKTINFFTCCGQTIYEFIDVYGPDGHRVLSEREHELQKARLKGIEDPPQICTCSGTSSTKPHTVEILDSDD